MQENIEYHLYIFVCFEKIADCFDRYVRCHFVRKVEFSRRNTAKSNAFYPFFRSKSETVCIASRKFFFVFFREFAAYYRSDRVQNVFARQVIRFCQFRFSCRFGVSLFCHNAVAFKPQLHSRKRVDSVVYAEMARRKTA